MATLNVTIGQILTLDELCNAIGADDAGNLSTADIRSRKQCNIDNFDGDSGHNVDFDIVTAGANDYAYQFTVKITDIYEI